MVLIIKTSGRTPDVEITQTGLPSLVWFHRGGRLMRRARGSERNFVVGGLARGHSVTPPLPCDAFLRPNIRPKQTNMSTNRASTANGAPEKTYFEQQREMLVGEIAQVKSTAPHLIHTAAHRCALNNAGH
jgi:hypothetical protein